MRTELAVFVIVAFGVAAACDQGPAGGGAAAPTAETREITARTFEVLSVYDGDTFTILYDGVKRRVRILGIDTPEMRPKAGPQYPAAVAARDAARELILGKVVRLDLDEKKFDAFGRLLARVYVTGPDGEEVEVGQWMIDNGHAVAYDG